MIGVAVWGYGQRSEQPQLRIIGMVILAIALAALRTSPLVRRQPTMIETAALSLRSCLRAHFVRGLPDAQPSSGATPAARRLTVDRAHDLQCRSPVDEITGAPACSATSASDVVQRLRPTFLIDRTAIRRSSQPIQVSINGGEITGTSVLNSTPASTVQEIRYLTYGQASACSDSQQSASGPVILVTLMGR